MVVRRFQRGGEAERRRLPAPPGDRDVESREARVDEHRGVRAEGKVDAHVSDGDVPGVVAEVAPEPVRSGQLVAEEFAAVAVALAGEHGEGGATGLDRGGRYVLLAVLASSSWPH